MDKKPRSAADLDTERVDDAEEAAEEPKEERVYDLDAPPVEEADAVSVEDGLAGDTPAGEDVIPATDEGVPAGGRKGLKFSRKDVLDRFQEKNVAITRLTKEKAALEKEKATLAASKSTLETQVGEFKDKWLRSAAEFENYRKRSAKEWELLKQQSKTEVILEVLNSLDDFERAFAVVGDQEESEFVRGIRLIYNNLLQVLQKLGVTEIDAIHQPFDPTRHMAIGQVDDTEVASGHVVEVAEKGYAMNGTVIRPARVIVAK